MKPSEVLLAKSKTPIRVGAELARGGEGAVHLLPDATDKLLKLYLKPQDEGKVRKLEVMTAGVSETLTRVAAWPLELVTDRQGRTLGFVMPRATSSTEAHELYTPKSRAQSFPEEDFRFLLHVAANIVRAFGTLHLAGYVIGDVNHGQVLVGKDGRVTLIDCDSIQVQANGQLYTCDVGVPLFTPPELQGRAFRGLHRTADHDRFGLAILLFQLLFMGRHPYAGVPLNPSQSTEIEAAIKADRFAYGSDCRSRGVQQPPGTLSLSTYGTGIAGLFERAFARQPITRRPDAKSWLDELKALQAGLKPCANSLAHHYPGHLASCPWCSVEARTGARLFGYKAKGGPPQQPLDIAALWGAVTAVPAPVAPAAPSTATLKLPRRSAIDRLRLQARLTRQFGAVVSGIVLVLLFALAHQLIAGLAVGAAAGFAIWPRVRSSERLAALKAEADAKAVLEAAQDTWRAAASGTAFSAIRQRCEEAKSALEGLPSERKSRLDGLKSEAKQREAFLDRFRIIKGEIPGIGAGRISNLNSFGIETAWDVTGPRIEALPGFGPTTAAKLVAWRRSKEALFRFNPNHPIAAAELNAIEAEFNSRTQHLAGILRSGPSLLRQTVDETARVLAVTTPLIEERWTAWQLAKRRRQDFYDGIASMNPAGVLIVSVAALIVLLGLLSQLPKRPVRVATSQVNQSESQVVATAPSRIQTVIRSAPVTPSTEKASASQTPAGNQANSAPSTGDETGQNLASIAPAREQEPITPANTPALSKAIADALDSGSATSWQADGERGIVTVGEARFYAGHPCRSFAYTVRETTSPTAYACDGADGVWRPETSFSRAGSQ